MRKFLIISNLISYPTNEKLLYQNSLNWSFIVFIITLVPYIDTVGSISDTEAWCQQDTRNISEKILRVNYGRFL